MIKLNITQNDANSLFEKTRKFNFNKNREHGKKQTNKNKQEEIYTSLNIEYQRINKVSAFNLILKLDHKD